MDNSDGNEDQMPEHARPQRPGLPKHFYIFANQTTVLTRHNLTFTKELFSAAYAYAGMSPEALRAYTEGTLDYLPYKLSTTRLPVVSPFTSGITSAYGVEYDAEVARQRLDPLLPSRFSAVFAFGDEGSCREVASRYNWDLREVRRFRLLPSSLNRIHRVNMEIVSMARILYAGPTAIGPEWTNALWEAYWSGAIGVPVEGMGNDGQRRILRPEPPIWEWLIEGRLRLVDE